jgi:hypothetical protein
MTEINTNINSIITKFLSFSTSANIVTDSNLIYQAKGNNIFNLQSIIFKNLNLETYDISSSITSISESQLISEEYYTITSTINLNEISKRLYLLKEFYKKLRDNHINGTYDNNNINAIYDKFLIEQNENTDIYKISNTNDILYSDTLDSEKKIFEYHIKLTKDMYDYKKYYNGYFLLYLESVLYFYTFILYYITKKINNKILKLSNIELNVYFL